MKPWCIVLVIVLVKLKEIKHFLVSCKLSLHALKKKHKAEILSQKLP